MKVRGKWVLLCTVIFFVLTLTAGTAFGVEDFSNLDQALSQQQQQSELQPDNLVLNFIKLIIVLGLITGTAWLIIRLFGRQVGTRMQGTWLHVVDEVMLGQNKGIVLCEIADKIYALGVTEGQITKLFELEDLTLLEEIKKQDNETSREGQSLNPFIRKGKIPLSLTKRKEKKFHHLMQEHLNKVKDLDQEYPQKRSDFHE
ncbi:MAG: flagellar biosynthetic protein FliO [Bacillota bacterium]|nr:flagellar biosynthetic protein FliO [Bacillota bacterium]